MIVSMKLKPILIDDQILSYAVNELEIDERLLQSYYQYDRLTIQTMTRIYSILLEALHNSISNPEDRDQAFKELVREGVLRHTYGQIEHWKNAMKAQLEREQLEKDDPTEVLYKKQIEHLVNLSALDFFDGFTSYLRSEKPLDDFVSETNEEEEDHDV